MIEHAIGTAGLDERAAPAAPADGRAPRLGDVRATLHREYRLLTRNRTNLLLSVTPTAVYIILFATSLTKLVGSVSYQGHRIGYAEFALPSLMLSSMLAAATTASTSLFQERLGRMEVELWSYPLRRGAYVGGKLFATTALVAAQTLAALLVALALFRFHWPATHWAGLFGVTLLAAVAFNGMYLLLVTLLKDFQRFTVIINVLGPVLLFASPSFYPPQEMATPLRWLSWADPVTYGINALRDVALSGFGDAWPWIAVLAGMAAVTCPLIVLGMIRRSRYL